MSKNENDNYKSDDDDDQNKEMSDWFEATGFRNDDDSTVSREELTVWLSEFMGKEQQARSMYRTNFLSLVVDRTFSEFGVEGMCELMMAIDKRAGWISDIIIEDADIHDQLFQVHGVYDNDAIYKARMCDQTTELNKKIWRLRKKYSKLIAEEIFTRTKPAKPASESETEF